MREYRACPGSVPASRDSAAPWSHHGSTAKNDPSFFQKRVPGHPLAAAQPPFLLETDQAGLDVATITTTRLKHLPPVRQAVEKTSSFDPPCQ